MSEFFSRLKGENIVNFVVLVAWMFSAIGGFLFAAFNGNVAVVLSVIVLIATGFPLIREILSIFLHQ